jgi:choloylglycine hydrolase
LKFGIPLLILVTAIVSPADQPQASACSRVLVNDNDIAKVVVRTMDLPLTIPEMPQLVVFPPGIRRDSSRSLLPFIDAEGTGIVGKQLTWTAKYGSVAIVSFGTVSTDGVNEHGLAVHMLYLAESQYEEEGKEPALGQAFWPQYILDNFKTVDEVVKAHEARSFRIVEVKPADPNAPDLAGGHVAIEDPTGDSAILEFLGGELVIHHGPEFRVMTNDPSYDEQLANLKRYKDFGGTLELPGGIEPDERFVRLSAYEKMLMAPEDTIDAVAGALSLMRIAQIPFRNPAMDTQETLWAGCQTNWVSAVDLTNKIYYFNSARSPSLIWVDLDDLSFKKGDPILLLDPEDPELGGNVEAKLAPISAGG